MIRALVAEVLEGYGYTVLAAGAAIAIADAPDTHIDLLLTDVVMPGMTGDSLRRRSFPARRAWPCSSPPASRPTRVIRHGIAEAKVLVHPEALSRARARGEDSLDARTERLTAPTEGCGSRRSTVARRHREARCLG